MRITVAGPADLNVLGVHLKDVDSATVFSFPYVSILGRAFRDAGHRVTFVIGASSIRPGEVIQRSAEGFDFVAVPRRTAPGKQALDGYRAERRVIARAISVSKPDVVHAHWTYEFGHGALATGIPSVITAHDAPLTVARHYRHPYWWLRARLGVDVVRRAPYLTAVSPSLLGELHRLRSRGSRPVEIIPNGLEMREPVPTHAPPSTGSFLTVANGFDDRKNTGAAIRALGRMRNAGGRQTLTMVGAGHEPNGQAHKWAKALNLDTGISFLGPIPNAQVLALMRGATALVHTSRWEACSIAILEAQREAVPVIAGRRSGGVAYTLDWGTSGTLVDIRNPEEIAEAMARVEKDRGYTLRTTANAQTGAAARFSLGDVASRYLDLMQDARRALRA